MAVGNQNIQGITIEIGGDTKRLQDALKDVDKTTKSTQRELRQVDNLLKFDPSNIELLTQRQSALTNTIQATSQRLDGLKQAQAEVERQFQSGEIGEEAYREFRREIIATEGRLEHFQRQARETQARIDVVVDDSNLSRTRRLLNNIGDDSKKVGKAVGDNLKKGFEVGAKGVAAFSAATIAGGVGLGAFIEENKELNTLLARLETNANTAGFDVEKMGDAFASVNAITGDTGAAIETVSNLMQTGFSEVQLEEALKSINGAAIAFSDTLKTEGIADGIQETFAIGEATGTFGELLERSGQDLEKFNAGLAKAKKNGTETDYVLQALAKTGVASNEEAYREANKSLVEYNEAQLESQIKSAELAKQLIPLSTNFMEFKNIIYDIGLGNITFAEGVGKITEKLLSFGVTLSKLAIEALPGLVQSFVDNYPALYKSGADALETVVGGLGSKMPEVIKSIVKVISTIMSTVIANLPQLLQVGFKLIGSLIQGIISSLPSVAGAMLKVMLKLIATIVMNFPQIVGAAVGLIGAFVKGIGSAAGQVYSYIRNNLIPSIKGVFKSVDWSQLGKDIINGLTKGITGTAKKAVDAVKNVASDVYGAAKKVLKIFSPSRAFAELGEFTNEGFVVGVERSAPRLMRTVNDLYGSLGRSAQQSINNEAANQTFITNNNGQNAESIISAIMALANRPLNAILEVDGNVLGQTVDTYQYGQNNIAAALKGVTF